LATFEGYDSYKAYFKKLEEEEKAAAEAKAKQKARDMMADIAAAKARQEALKQTA
jgi:hypothetical protein